MGDIVIIISTIAVWMGMIIGIVAMYFIIHALIADAYYIADWGKQIYWYGGERPDPEWVELGEKFKAAGKMSVNGKN